MTPDTLSRAELVERVRVLEAAMGMDTPWSTLDILAKLIEATDHLLGTHGCDTHGHELFRAAAIAGKARLVPYSYALAPVSVDAREAGTQSAKGGVGL